MSKRPHPSHTTSEDDEALWQKALQDLHRHSCASKEKTSDDDSHSIDFYLPSYHPEAFSPLASDHTIQYRQNGISIRQFQRYFAYPFRPQYTLDLHHMRTELAYDACQQALSHCRRQGIRRCRFICGKGRHGISIMKGMVLYVLERTDWVLAYRSADTRQGGTGAIEIYLKNK